MSASKKYKVPEQKPFAPEIGDEDVYVLDLSKHKSIEAKKELEKFKHGHIYPFYVSKRVSDDRVLDGTFVIKRLTFDEVGEVGVLKARLNQGLIVDNNTDFINWVIAYLKVAIVTAPTWWEDEETRFHGQLIRTVFEVALEWNNSF